MRWPTVTAALGISFITCVFAACNGGSDSLPTAPSAPTAPVLPSSSPWNGELSDWIGDLTLVSCSGNVSLCSSVGKTLSGRRWRVALSGTTIDLHEIENDMAFRGTIDGRRFVATRGDIPLGPEDHANLEGEFAEDFNSFEAVGTYVNGPPFDYGTVWHYRVVRVE